MRWCVNIPEKLARELELCEGERLELRIVDKRTMEFTRPDLPAAVADSADRGVVTGDSPAQGGWADFEEVAGAVLEGFLLRKVEDVWDQAGSDCLGYTAPDEVVTDMVEEELQPFIEDIADCRKEGKADEGELLCRGVVLGLYRFTKTDSSFAEIAADDCLLFAERIVREWIKAYPASAASINAFVAENCPGWARIQG